MEWLHIQEIKVQKGNLLIIEDEPSVSKQLKWALEPEYSITIVSDADTARQYLSSGAYPVATLDLGLPPSPDSPEAGLKLLEDIAELALPTKIIVITGNRVDQAPRTHLLLPSFPSPNFLRLRNPTTIWQGTVL